MPPDGTKKILWVCGRFTDALKRRDEFGAPENVKFICAGAMLAGEGFDEIILDDIYAEVRKRNSAALEAQITNWVNLKLQCRLFSNSGRIRKLVDIPYE